MESEAGNASRDAVRSPGRDEPDLDEAIEARFGPLEHHAERANVQLRMEIESLRKDFSARLAEQSTELAVERDARRKVEGENERLAEDVRRSKALMRELKAQNLELQHRIGEWGLPVSESFADERAMLATDHSAGRAFFPKVLPLVPDIDPVPISLRGDLTIFHLTSLLGLLSSDNLVGVLTIRSEDIVTKLYVEGSLLRLAAWNRRDDELGLIALLVESELLTEETAARLVEAHRFDLEIAESLVESGELDTDAVRACLREHSRVIISHLFQLRSGAFFFQEGRLEFRRDILFELSVTDLLLRTATRIDEESRDLSPDAPASAESLEL